MSHSMRADSNRGPRRRRRNRHPDAGEAAVRITAISSKNSKRNYAHASTHIVHCVRAIVGARSTSGCRVVIDFGFSTVVLLRNSMTFAHSRYEFHTKKRSIMAPQACETHRAVPPRNRRSRCLRCTCGLERTGCNLHAVRAPNSRRFHSAQPLAVVRHVRWDAGSPPP